MSTSQIIGYLAFHAIAILVFLVVFSFLAVQFVGWAMDTFERLVSGTAHAPTEPAEHGPAAGTWTGCGR